MKYVCFLVLGLVLGIPSFIAGFVYEEIRFFASLGRFVADDTARRCCKRRRSR